METCEQLRSFEAARPSLIRQAIFEAEERARRKPVKEEPKVFSSWNCKVERDGVVIYDSGWVHNLTTDTAVGYTNRRDWQAKSFGGGFAPFATATGDATATSATSLTNAGASFPTAGQGLAGFIVIASRNSAGTGSTVWGVIMSNTSTVLTVDQWYAGGTWAAGTTPNATAAYVIIPAQAPAAWMAVTADATAPTSADTGLATEATTNGFARALSTYAHSAAASTYTSVVVFTASGSLTPAVMGMFGSAVANKGVMPFKSAIPSPPVMISGDVCTVTETVTIN